MSESFTIKNVNCNFLLQEAYGPGPLTVKGDPRTIKPTTVIKLAKRGKTYSRKTKPPRIVPGIVVGYYSTATPRIANTADYVAYQSAERASFEMFNFIYKVWTPCVKAELTRADFEDANKEQFLKKVAAMADVTVSLGVGNVAQGAIPPGTLVDVKFTNRYTLKNPQIVKVKGKIFDISSVFPDPPGRPFLLGSPGGAAYSLGSPPGLTTNDRPGAHDDGTSRVETTGRVGGAEFAGPTPNADWLRSVLSTLGPNFSEKVKKNSKGELANGGDMDSRMAKVTAHIFATIKAERPDIKIKITGGNDTAHKIGRKCGVSRHRCGLAIDMVVGKAGERRGWVGNKGGGPHSEKLDAVVKILQRYAAGNGGRFRYIDEYRHPSGHATGGHVHMSWGSPDDKESGRVMREAQQMASSGQITPLDIPGVPT